MCSTDDVRLPECRRLVTTAMAGERTTIADSILLSLVALALSGAGIALLVLRGEGHRLIADVSDGGHLRSTNGGRS